MNAAQLFNRIRSLIGGKGGRRFVLAFVSAVVARLGLLALAILLARALGAGDYGTFVFATGAAALAANVALMGWPDLFNRLYPRFVREADWNRLKGLRDSADAVVIAALAAAAALLFGFSILSSKLHEGFAFAALFVIPLGVVMLRKQQLAALKRPAVGLLFDQGFAAIVVAVIVLITGLDHLPTIALLYAGTTLAGLLVTTVMVRRLLPAALSRARRVTDIPAWFGMALPMMTGAVSKVLINRMDVLMLAPLATIEAVGIYGAAWRLTYLLSFPQVVLMTVAKPLLSEAFAAGNFERVRSIGRLSAVYAFVTTAPLLLIFLLAPSRIMDWVFGADFAVGGTTLMILGIGQFVAAFTAVNASLLLMGGGEREFGMLNIAVLGIALLLNFALIPRYGANGTAFTIAISSSLLLLGQTYFSRRLISQREASDAAS